MVFKKDSLADHFKLHKADTGNPWLGRSFKTADEYLQAARSVINDPKSKKVIYYHQNIIKLENERLGYLLEKNGKVFLVSVNRDGFISTFHNLKYGWSYLDNTNVFAKLLKLY